MLFITCETLPVPSIAQFKVPITIGLAKFVHLCILIWAAHVSLKTLSDRKSKSQIQSQWIWEQVMVEKFFSTFQLKGLNWLIYSVARVNFEWLCDTRLQVINFINWLLLDVSRSHHRPGTVDGVYGETSIKQDLSCYLNLCTPKHVGVDEVIMLY